ncbi:hypothetical protein [Streptomyces halobius]|uniref:Secreted protein n=1 Tax=Streptomyces halobius TaxID=2879846 RepID=A0ABY4MEJ1_9ACTN|nr:hypothetical protein [Streptomyces halobius]UQA96204.1 hypothetical protein K9S39_33865 [Streptomyces halobius]
MPISRRRTAALTITLAAFLGATAPAVQAVPPAASDDPQELPHPQCRTKVVGSTGTASCFNPNGNNSKVQLHIECKRWYDPDVDTRGMVVGPAQHITLAGRCWQEIADLWVSDVPGG